jgi:hypothetical protein
VKPDIVTGLRAKVWALTLIAGMLAAMSGTALAQNPHPFCAARQHECGGPATISSCCCGDLGGPHDTSAPAQPRTHLPSDGADAVAPTVLPDALANVARAPRAQTSPPHPSAVDLPTLFVTLLI